MPKKFRFFHKLVSFISGLSLILQSFVPLFSYSLLTQPVYADNVTPTEEVTPSQEPTSEPTFTPTPTEEVTSTPTVEVTPDITPQPTVSITPTEEVSPTSEPTQEQPAPSQSSEPPHETSPPTEQGQILDGVSVTATPEPTITPALSEHGTLSAIIIPSIKAADTLDLDVVDHSSATLTTDKADYAPTDTVIITGKGFTPDKIYILTISSLDPPAVSHNEKVTADGRGDILFTYQLDGNFRPNYKVEVKDGEVVVARTTFTDSLTTVSATVNGTSSVTVYPGTAITIAVTATLTSTNVWHRTVGRISTVGVFNFDTGTNRDICENTPDHDTPGTYTESVIVNAPSSVGTYNVYVRTAGGENCNSATNDADLVLTGAVVVVSDTTPPVCPVPVLSSISGSHYINGNTIYYSPVTSTTGSFKLTENATDDLLMDKVNFPTIATFTGGGNNDTTSPFEGTYAWNSLSSNSVDNATITCYDNAGNTSTTTFNIRRDATQPTLNSVILDDYTVKNGATINVTSDGADADSGVGYCHAFWSTNTSADLSSDIDLGNLGTDCDGPITVPAGAGTFYVKVKVGDNVGYYPNPLASSSVLVDNTAPTTSDDTGFGGQTYLTSKTFTLTPNDLGGSGVADTKYCVADFPATCAPDTSGTSVTVTCPAGVASCPNKWIFYYSIDNAGNTGATSHSYSFTITNDITPPTVGTVTVSPSSKFYSGTPNYVGTGITISASASDTNGVTGCEYTMNGGTSWNTATYSGVNCSQTINSGINTGATYAFIFRATDTFGNVGYGTELDATGDITNPTVTINSPAVGAVTNGAMSFKYTPADVGSGLATCDLYLNYPSGGGAVVYSTNSSPTNNVENTFSITGLTTDGNYVWDVQCADKVGYNGVSQDWSTHRTFIVDKTAPTVVLTDNHPDSIVRDADTVVITATFTETDQIDETTPPTLSINSVGIVNSAPMTKVTNKVWTYSWDVPAAYDGTHTVTISAHDRAGNVNAAATGKTSYTIDNTAPTGSAIIANNYYGPNSYSATTIAGLANDSGSGINRVEMSILNNGGNAPHADWFTNCWRGSHQWADVCGVLEPLSQATYDSIGHTWTYGGLSIANFTSGNSYQITPIAYDNAGNSISGTSDTFTWDDQSPTSHVSGLASYQVSRTFNVSYTANDPLSPSWAYSQRSGLKEVDLYYRLNSGSWTKYGTFTSSPISFTASTDGTYGFYTIARDNALNEESAKSSAEATTIVDATAPVVGTITITPSYLVGGNLIITSLSTISAPVTDVGGSGINPTSCRYSIDGGASGWTTVASAYDSSTGRCIFTNIDTASSNGINVGIDDNAGNGSNGTNTWVSVTVDKTPPTTTADGGVYNFGTWTNQNVTVDLACFDGESGCKNTYWCYDDGSTACVPGVSGLNHQTNMNTFTFDANGVWYLRYQSDDNAGNLGAVQTQIIKIDKTTPTGGSISYSSGYYTTASVDLTVNQGTDTGSGINTGSRIVLRNEAVLSNGVCGSFGPFGKIYPSGVYPNLTDTTVIDGHCYSYEYLVSDNTFNETTYTSSNIAPVDTTKPTTPIANPGTGNYTSTGVSVTLSSSDTGSGLDTIFYTTDDTSPDISGTKVSYPLDDSAPITVDHDLTIKAIAYDNAGNVSNMLTATYGIPPIISAETSASVTSDSVTITWTTDDLSTSRVVYDTVSHLDLGEAPSYGYAYTTTEDSNKVTSHSVALSGLSSSTTYYYRVVSHGSPETVSALEQTFTTSSPPAVSGGGGGAGDGLSDGRGNTTACTSSKPGSAPKLISAVTGPNTVTLTWTAASTPVTYYLVTYGTGPGLQQFGNPNVGGIGTTRYTVRGLSGGSTYYFRVRAGNGCMPGDYSNELSATPGGEFVEGPAAGFEAGVLGTTTEKVTPSATPTPEEILGTENQPTASDTSLPWFFYLAGFGGAVTITLIHFFTTIF